MSRLRKPSTAPAPAVEGSDDTLLEGQRNDALFRSACRLYRAKFPQTSVETMLQAENRARCQPPLDEAEVSAVARSAFNITSQGGGVVLLTTEEHLAVDDCCRALIADDAVYQRGGELVRVVRTEERLAKASVAPPRAHDRAAAAGFAT